MPTGTLTNFIACHTFFLAFAERPWDKSRAARLSRAILLSKTFRKLSTSSTPHSATSTRRLRRKLRYSVSCKATEHSRLSSLNGKRRLQLLNSATRLSLLSSSALSILKSPLACHLSRSNNKKPISSASSHRFAVLTTYSVELTLITTRREVNLSPVFLLSPTARRRLSHIQQQREDQLWT